ncbi:MAG TPA: type IV secretion system DNA-binding domain-containing protein, partial [Chthoniobacterales bacterium]|nr:type IV secretion system DNA-binding domain-containing protein [Chthoniobacterales bacterium]
MNFPLIALLSFLGSLELAFILPHNWRLIAFAPMIVPIIALFIPKKEIYARILGLPSVAEDFTRGWLITGFTGSGKTMALTYLLFQIFKRVPNFGALFLDQKGVFWEIITRMAKHFGREKDLILIRTRPLQHPGDPSTPPSWEPTH